jgi:hypothetical protein
MVNYSLVNYVDVSGANLQQDVQSWVQSDPEIWKTAQLYGITKGALELGADVNAQGIFQVEFSN